MGLLNIEGCFDDSFRHFMTTGSTKYHVVVNIIMN
jgi:hypothetical protein